MDKQPNNPWAAFARGMAVAPSLLACDYMRLSEQIAAVEAAGTRLLHADVMDGHFVPNLAISPGLVRSVRAGTDRLLDVHLMVADPVFFSEPFVKAGADSITFHIETVDDPRRMVDHVRELGVGVGVVLKPATPASAIESVAALVDLVLIMTVEPGFGGQAFMTEQLDKIRAVRAMVGPDVRVEVDGGINAETGAACAAAGADTFVAGSSIFGAADVGAAFEGIQRAADAAAEGR